MTEEEVLKAIENFKNAIIQLKAENKSLKEEIANLKNNTINYNTQVVEKIKEIESLIND